ncbi:hypothetical protein [Xanthocytophaga agilis]|uniref:Uncharacterized protein n=1 Tax=Xanthocytophaga agilis TaxID=3048010 RepID=A0AAE3UIR2_9BACT|nr:hypothetical protein [Xanthocytophaga agilis]MDJ1504033.1 hypothetical protein [Xanthocytophaga agilis]
MFKQLLPFLLTGIVLITACKPDNDETPTPQKTCRLTDSQSITLYPDNSRDTITIHYEYNSQGLLVSTKNISSGIIIYTTNIYNSEGFLTEQKTTTESTNPGQGIVKYTYIQGKLSRFNTTYESTSYQYTNEFNYNTDGKMTSMIWKGKSLSNDGSVLGYKDSILYRYTDRKLTEILAYYQRDGLRDYNYHYTVETDEKGRMLSKSKEDGYKIVYQYNADGELINLKNYYIDLLESYTVYEYDTKKDIETLINPIPKGHPANISGEEVHNMTKQISYDKNDYNNSNPTHTLQEYESYLYEYEYNEQGYPTKKIQKYTSNGQTRITTTTYNITCQ